MNSKKTCSICVYKRVVEVMPCCSQEMCIQCIRKLENMICAFCRASLEKSVDKVLYEELKLNYDKKKQKETDEIRLEQERLLNQIQGNNLLDTMHYFTRRNLTQENITQITNLMRQIPVAELNGEVAREILSQYMTQDSIPELDRMGRNVDVRVVREHIATLQQNIQFGELYNIIETCSKSTGDFLVIIYIGEQRATLRTDTREHQLELLSIPQKLIDFGVECELFATVIP
jgi:hypothetical protein